MSLKKILASAGKRRRCKKLVYPLDYNEIVTPVLKVEFDARPVFEMNLSGSGAVREELLPLKVAAAVPQRAIRLGPPRIWHIEKEFVDRSLRNAFTFCPKREFTVPDR
jgi:hypothetical protein